MKNEKDFEIELRNKKISGHFLFPSNYVLDSTFENIFFLDITIENGSFSCSLFKNYIFKNVIFLNTCLEHTDFKNNEYQNISFQNTSTHNLHIN